MRSRAGRWSLRALAVVLGIAVLCAIWEAYKSWGPDDGVKLFGTRVLPRTTDAAMPHLSSIWHALWQSEVGNAISFGPTQTVLESVLKACLNSLRWASVGFVIGVVVGMLLAVIMDRAAILERALLPYVVLSQTVPLIALAPLVTGWGNGSSIGPLHWQRWMSVSVIAAYLAFFPVAVGMVRGLKSPSAVHTEYFRCSAAGWWRTLRLLKIPASIPFLIPALRLGAAGAVVGTVVAEISTGLEGGIGRLILTYSQSATGDPSRVYVAVLGAALLGLVAAAVVSLADLALWRYHRAAQ